MDLSCQVEMLSYIVSIFGTIVSASLIITLYFNVFYIKSKLKKSEKLSKNISAANSNYSSGLIYAEFYYKYKEVNYKNKSVKLLSAALDQYLLVYDNNHKNIDQCRESLEEIKKH